MRDQPGESAPHRAEPVVAPIPGSNPPAVTLLEIPVPLAH
jgi:hypothetical protein